MASKCYLRGNTSFRAPRINDFHFHLRQDFWPDGSITYQHTNQVLLIAPFIRYVLGMGNLKGNYAILNGQMAIDYAAKTERIATLVPGNELKQIPSIKITRNTPADVIFEADRLGVRHAKVYPGDARRTLTTHSDDGVIDYPALLPVWEAIQACSVGRPRGDKWKLSQHGEAPNSYIMESEADFRAIMDYLLGAMPDVLHIAEHLTDARMIRYVASGPNNLAGTLTAHHPFLEHDDVLRPLAPHNHCMPTAKKPRDKKAIRHTAVEANPRFFFGSDSAMWDKADKLHQGCAGVFTAPIIPSILAQLFDEEYGGVTNEMVEAFRRFTHENGCAFYGLEPSLNERPLLFIRKPMIVPPNVCGAVPWLAGQQLPWSWEVLSKE